MPGKLGAAGVHGGSHGSSLTLRNVLSWEISSGLFAADRLGAKETGTSVQVLGER